MHGVCIEGMGGCPLSEVILYGVCIEGLSLICKEVVLFRSVLTSSSIGGYFTVIYLSMYCSKICIQMSYYESNL